MSAQTEITDTLWMVVHQHTDGSRELARKNSKDLSRVDAMELALQLNGPNHEATGDFYYTQPYDAGEFGMTIVVEQIQA